MSETILAVCADGKFAGLLIPELARRGAKVRGTARALRPMFDHYDRIGLRGSALTLRAILGRSPRTLRAYFEELAA